MLHVTRQTSHVTRHKPNSLLHTTRRIDCPLQAKSPAHQSNVTHHTSHVTRHTSHITRHTSHVTRHTSHVNAPLMPRAERCCNCAGSTRAPSTQKAAGSYLQEQTPFGTPATKSAREHSVALLFWAAAGRKGCDDASRERILPTVQCPLPGVGVILGI